MKPITVPMSTRNPEITAKIGLHFESNRTIAPSVKPIRLGDVRGRMPHPVYGLFPMKYCSNGLGRSFSCQSPLVEVAYQGRE